MKIKIKVFLEIMVAVLLFTPVLVYASDGDEYITISVQASDDNEGLTYALDSPDNFGPSNTFTIPAGTSHTIYVKDAAGNVTSQVYEPPGNGTEKQNSQSGSGSSGSQDYDGYSYYSDSDPSNDVPASSSEDEDGQTINIDLEFGKSTDSGKPYEIKQDTPAEQGEGTVYSKTFLDGTDSSEQVYYSVTTEEGNVFHLLIDQGQEDNNVYLLKQVKCPCCR